VLAKIGREQSEGGVVFKSRFDNPDPKAVAAVVRLEESRFAEAARRAQLKQRRVALFTV